MAVISEAAPESDDPPLPQDDDDSMDDEKQDDEQEKEYRESPKDKEGRGLLHDQKKVFPAFHPSRLPFRICIMILACFITTGGYMAYDSVGAIAPELRESMGIGPREIGIFIAVYSLPNIVMCFLGGILCDTIGYNKASMLFNLVVTVGMVIVSFAPSFEVMLLGRLIFGLGSESLVVAQTAILTQWFRGKELALSYGVSLTFGRFGSILAFWILPSLAKAQGFRAAFYLASAFCAFSAVVNVLLALLDSYGIRKMKKDFPDSDISGDQDRLSFKDIFKLNSAFWIVTVICLCFYGSAMPFTTFATDFISEKYGYDGESSARLSSIIYIASIIVSPIFGWWVDTYGYRPQLLLSGSLVLIPVFVAFALTTFSPAILIGFLGYSFALVPAALWPLIPLIVEKKLIGTAFGTSYSLYNGVAFFSPIMYGYLRTETNTWVAGNLVYAGLGFVGSVACIALWYLDVMHLGGKLKAPSPGTTKPSFSCFSNLFKKKN